MKNLFFAFGSGFSLLSVVFGAFGAHALEEKLFPKMLDTFEVAVRYQMYHGIGLILVAWALSQWQNSLTTAAGWCFIAGYSNLFGKSLYLQFDQHLLAWCNHTDWWD